jgi:hypothetical protein
MTIINQLDRGNRRHTGLPVLAALAAAVALSACGGTDGPVVAPEPTAQQQKEAAALQRAHQMNASTMRQIQSERAGRQARNQ